MAPRKSPNQLSPQDFPIPASSSVPPSPSFPRSTSPSNGFTQFFSKPGKWFNRKPSSGGSSPGATEQPRSSISSNGRKPRISRPTDPRPILASKFQSSSRISSSASRSVLDLSTRPPGSLDISHSFPSPIQHSSPGPGGLGDLRNISRKAWSRSADDLGKLSSSTSSPVDASFHNKVTEYRNRSNSNATLAPSTVNITTNNMRQPFPTIVTTSPLSSSPQDDDFPISAVSISVSSPSSFDKPLPFELSNSAPIQVHNRSHSFTPRLPSKLSPQKLGFGPPSPKRKGSAVSERETERDREIGGLDARGPSNIASSVNRPPSPTTVRPSAINNLATSTGNGVRPNAMLSPPTIAQPEDEDDLPGSNSKRTSQIVYNSGFINRLTELPASHHPYHAPNLTLAKGWKPFKLELKGPKLFFYKPPSDRSAAVRDLFPVDLVPALVEEDQEGDNVGDRWDMPRPRRVSGKEEGTSTRKKRAYWGRGTHPELVHGENGIEKGTFEALVHETVFATTFLKSSAGTSRTEQGGVSPDQMARWRDFASAIVLCLPSLVGSIKFENEFTRCCAYLVSGVDEDRKEDQRSRVAWLAGEYLRCHGKPAEASEWEEWRSETIPDFQFHIASKQVAGIATSSSTQAIYTRSPEPGGISPNLDGGVLSPNLGTFSPRPEADDKMALLMEALSGPAVPGSPSGKAPVLWQPTSLASNHRIWAALEREGLSRDVLLVLDPHLIAHSLGLFHRQALKEIPENLTAEYIIGPDVSKVSNPLSEMDDGPSSTALFGSDKSPHWLTKILLMQILGVDTSTGNLSSLQNSSSGRVSEDRVVQTTSRTHSRSEVISVWARIGELCRLAGDECSWRAIAAALCSRPVARLDKAWKRVHADALAIVDFWVYPAADGECASVRHPKITPWGGDVKDGIKEALEKARGESGEEWLVSPLTRVREIFEGTRTTFSLCPRRSDLDESAIEEDIARLMAFWGELCAGNVRNGTLGSKFLHIEQFMSLSLAAEPRRKGLFEPHFWSQAFSGQLSSHPLVPLLFPQPLPVMTFIDRGEIWRGRTESGVSHIKAADLQFLRSLELQLHSHKSSGSKDLLPGFGDVDLLGSIIAVYEGELLLVIPRGSSDATPASSRTSSRAPSRPASTIDDAGSIEQRLSRTPSIRVKTGPLDRKPSLARRNSLPSISQRPTVLMSESSSEPPLRVLVHAGTVDRLVNILTHGLQGVSISVADDNGEMSLREGKTRDLTVNHKDFARVWWTVFRSFVTPLVFFELLRKQYLGLQSPRQLTSVTDCLDSIRGRSQVINVLNEWIFQGNGAQDVLDDGQLFNAMRSFLDNDVHRVAPAVPAFNDFSVQQAWNASEQNIKSLISSFNSQIMRPTCRDISTFKLPVGNSKTRNLGRDPPDIDRIDPEQLVDNLDAMAAAAFSNVSEEDLFVTVDLLEVQMADRTGWFLPREAISTAEDVEIQTMYSHILEVEPSPMISELSQGALYRILPPGVRSCIRAYGILRKWLISKLVAFQIGIRARQARMDILLRAIEIARIRSADSVPVNLGIAERPCIRSFVETVLTSAVISVESRAHHRAWQNVAAARGVQCDSLTSLLRKPFVELAAPVEPLTVDMSWLLERILEIISIPDILRPTSEEGPSVVNFDKRRHIYNLIINAPTLAPISRTKRRNEVDRRDFERLNNIEKEVNILQFDQRGIREEAHRESIHAAAGGSSSARKAVRPFQKLCAMQLEKNKRDKYLRDRVSKEKKQEQQRSEKRDEHINKGVRNSVVPTPRQHRNKKSMSSAFFQFMRPISSAFTSEHLEPGGLRRTPAELDFTPSGKPSLVLSVVDARVAQFINNERSFTFQLDTEDGGHYLLQALSRREMTKWLDTINRVSKMAAKRRLTYLGNPKPQLADHIHNSPATASQDPTAVFGVELQFLLKREAANGEVLPGAIPFVVERCLYEVESRGLGEVGIYRIAGAASEINALREAFNRGESPIQPSTDINAVCDLIKTWFRVLTEPLFPPSSYHDVIEAMKIDDFDSRLSKIRTIVRALPQANFDVLKRVAEHLDKVTDFEEQNHMTAEALAIVFSPNLLRAPRNDFAMILANMGHTHKLVKSLITHFHVIFDDVDQEVENDQDEDEFDEPILEEDEEDEDIPHSPSKFDHEDPNQEHI